MNEVKCESITSSQFNVLNQQHHLEAPDPRYEFDCWYPSNLMDIIKYIIALPPTKMRQPEFRFEMTNAAADFNWKILEKYNKCLSSAIEAQNNTQMTYGSEFKSTDDLELIFKNHPLWISMKDQLKNGCDYPLTEINDKDLRDDVIESLSYGNHKGVSENLEVFHQMMNDEVEFG